MKASPFADMFKHPDFPGLAGRAFFIVSAGFLALCAGGYFWLNAQSGQAVEMLRDRMPSVSATIGGPNALPTESTATADSAIKSSSIGAPHALLEQDSQAQDYAQNNPPAAQTTEITAPPTPQKTANTENHADKKAEKTPSPALVAAPIEGLFVMEGDGVLPIIREKDGLTPFEAYRRPFPATDGPKIALVVLDIGLSPEASAAAIKTLPPEASLVISPYADALDTLQAQARGQGHELWLSLPLESSAVPSPDPGAKAIYLNASMERNKERLLWTLGRTIGYAGVAAITPSPVLASESQARRLLGNVFSRGLALADLSEKPAKTAKTEASMGESPYIGGGLFADSHSDPESLRETLDLAARKAFKDNSAVVVIHPYPASLKEVQKWIAGLENQGITLAPLSALTKGRKPHASPPAKE